MLETKRGELIDEHKETAAREVREQHGYGKCTREEHTEYIDRKEKAAKEYDDALILLSKQQEHAYMPVVQFDRQQLVHNMRLQFQVAEAKEKAYSMLLEQQSQGGRTNPGIKPKSMTAQPPEIQPYVTVDTGAASTPSGREHGLDDDTEDDDGDVDARLSGKQSWNIVRNALQETDFFKRFNWTQFLVYFRNRVASFEDSAHSHCGFTIVPLHNDALRSTYVENGAYGRLMHFETSVGRNSPNHYLHLNGTSQNAAFINVGQNSQLQSELKARVHKHTQKVTEILPPVTLCEKDSHEVSHGDGLFCSASCMYWHGLHSCNFPMIWVPANILPFMPS